MEMQLSPYFVMGIGVGALLGIILVALIIKKRRVSYDERQRALRGRCYMAAFWVLVAFNFANGCLGSCGIIWGDPITMAIVGICLAAGVFAVYCIFLDAYIMVRERPGRCAAIIGLLGAVNLANGLIGIAGGELVSGGRLTFRASSLAVAALSAVVLAALFIKFIILRDRGDEE